MSDSSLASRIVPQSRPLTGKIRLALRVWLSFARVQVGMRRRPLPAYAAQLGRPRRLHSPALAPQQLSRAVDRSLRLGAHRPRCLTSALVLFRLLREQGDAAELVIGLPAEPSNHEAHAWVELEGLDVGPPPGRGGHETMARFG